MTKAIIRKEYRKLRQDLALQQQDKLNDLILIQFQSLKIPFINTLLSYYPIESKNEPDTFLISSYLNFTNPNLQICYPRTEDNLILKALAVEEDSEFEKGQYNIIEPISAKETPADEIDFIIIPLLAFDLKGNRVGYGKGYYDKFLTKCSKDCIKLGISFFEPVAEIIDRQYFDVPLDLCVTPYSTYVF